MHPLSKLRLSSVGLLVLSVLGQVGATGCERPPRSESSLRLDPSLTHEADDATTSSGEPPPPTAALPTAVAAPLPSSGTERTAESPSPSSTASSTLLGAVPSLFDEGGTMLPQTEETPTASSPSLQRRLELLVAAIATDDPTLALPSFFPVEAYAQVKAIAKPELDWKRRLVGAFERNIREYHRKLGSSAAGARLLRVEIPEAKIKWMKPGSEGNRVGYHRVLRSKVVVETREGREVPLELTSMISWRGEWYIVHLHGFD